MDNENGASIIDRINAAVADKKPVQIGGTLSGKSGPKGFLLLVESVKLGEEEVIKAPSEDFPAVNSEEDEAKGCITLLVSDEKSDEFKKLSDAINKELTIEVLRRIKPQEEGNSIAKTLFLLTTWSGRGSDYFKIVSIQDAADLPLPACQMPSGASVEEGAAKHPAFPDVETLKQKCQEQKVFLDPKDIDRVHYLLKNKKNIILQGPPGTGKTFFAKRLAEWLSGPKEDGRWKFVQFHQNTTYDDFVYGWRPCEHGFEPHEGTFFRFCKKAAADPDGHYVMIIDEINRGRISAIFGDLLMLIEESHRDEEVELPFKKMPERGGETADDQPSADAAPHEEAYVTLKVPNNVYIIGCMNTADRSIAVIDYALRRRFAFFTMKPQLDKIKAEPGSKLEEFIESVKDLNKEIEGSVDFGEGFCIGHSYLCPRRNGEEVDVNAVRDYELIPLIEEYCYDDREKLAEWTNILKPEGADSSGDKR